MAAFDPFLPLALHPVQTFQSRADLRIALERKLVDLARDIIGLLLCSTLFFLLMRRGGSLPFDRSARAWALVLGAGSSFVLAIVFGTRLVLDF